MIEVGTAAAQGAGMASDAAVGDVDAAVLRVAILDFLRQYASGIDVEGTDVDLLAAYRDWLEVAVRLWGTGDEALVSEYVRRGAILTAEMELAAARESGRLSPGGVPA